MASLTLEQFADLVELQVRDYERTDYVSLLTDIQDHPAAKALLKKTRMSRDGAQAEGVYWKLRMKTAASWRHVTPTTPDAATITNDFVGMSAPWRKVEVGYAFLEEEIDFNMSPNQIVNLVKAREAGCDFDFIEGLEVDFWNFPLASDALAFYSLPYWCVKNATTGFNGGIPSGYTTVGGLSPTTYPRLKNYTAQYVDVTLDDFVAKARDMVDLTYFKPPVAGVPDLGQISGPSKSFYTTLSVRKKFADVADSRNDNLGPDVATMDGRVMFRGAEIVWVPALDADTTNPFYQIPWDVFKMMVKPGWWQKRTMLKPYPGQRNQVAVFKDSYLNFACFNRRALGVLATGITYP